MGFLSNIFKPKTKPVVETRLGDFTLTYSKGDKNIWLNNNAEMFLSVQGNDKEPDAMQISFLENISAEIQKLDNSITKKFGEIFTEADLEANFTDWKQRFKIGNVEVMSIVEGEPFWNITFEDQREPFAHFILYVEGLEITDFSMDT